MPITVVADRRGPLRAYCTGLMLPGDRKSVEPMAARTAPARTAACVSETALNVPVCLERVRRGDEDARSRQLVPLRVEVREQ